MTDEHVQQAYHHITEFYRGNNVPELQKWMSDFSKSIEAWTICDRILGERKDSLSCCFAAQTLRQKILQSLNEIPSESYLSLRESLINHLSHIHPTPGDSLGESTITQLCLAIADLYIQIPDWNNWITPFLRQCSTLTGDRTQMMLHLLKVFPEELKSIRVGENRRKAIREELAASATDVFAYLRSVLDQFQSDEDIVKRVFSCVAAYLDNPALCTDPLANGDLLPAAFHLFSMAGISPSLHDAVTECIVAGTIIAEDHGAHLALAKSIQRQTYGLVNPFHAAVARDDLYQLQNYARVFTELNESLIEKIVNDPSSEHSDTANIQLGCLYSLELLLLLAGHHDYSIIEKTFNVWYRLSEAFFVIDDDNYLERYKPYVNRYIAALYRHARFDTDEEDVPDESNEFVAFRMKVAETVKDVVYIISTDNCMNMMYEMLKTCASNQNSTWDEMESALYIMAAVVHNLLPESKNSVLPDVVNSITSLPASTHPCLIVTSVELLGGCDEWLEKHPEFHHKVLNWLLLLVANPKFSKYTSDSIEKIVTRSSRQLTSVYPHLMGHIAVLEKSTTKGREMEVSATNLLKAATAIVVNMQNLEIRSCLNQMCEPIALRLNQILSEDDAKKAANDENAPATDSWEFVAKDAIIWVDRISAIFKQIKPWSCDPNGPPIPAPWTEISGVLFERLQSVLNRYQARQRVVEHACRSLRYLVRSLGPQSCIYLEPIIQELMAIYTNYPHSCILYLASILVDEYGTIDMARPGLLQMLQHLAAVTFHFFETRGNGVQLTMRDNPDTVDDFFRLAGRFVQRAPSTFFDHPVSAEIYRYALLGLALDHQDASRSVTKFFSDHVDQLNFARKHNYNDAGVQKAKAILTSLAPQIIFSCLHSAIFSVSGNLRRDMAEVIYIIGKYDPVQFKDWVTAAVSQLPKGGLAATDAQLQQFVFNITDNPLCVGSRELFCEIRDLIQLYN